MRTIKTLIREIDAGYDLRDIEPVDDAPQRLKQVAQRVLEDENRLDMGNWLPDEAYQGKTRFGQLVKDCCTAACIAGWALLLAKADGKRLLKAGKVIDCDPEADLGRMLLGYEAAEHFMDEHEDAIEFLKSVVEG